MPHHEGEAPREVSPVRDYLRVVVRNKWVVLLPLVLVPIASFVFSLQQQKLYEASAEVLLSYRNLAAALTGTPDSTVFEQPDRIAETQARLAEVPPLAERVLEATGTDDRSARDLLLATDVSVKQNADILEFRVTDPDPAVAARLATAYAREFIRFRHELDTAALVRARRGVEDQIAELEESGDRDSELYASLVDKQEQLRTMEALLTANASLVQSAEGAAQVQPRVVQNVALGAMLGLVLSFALVLLLKAFDTGLRSPDEIAERLGLPLLGRVPKPARRLQKRSRLVMLADPHSAAAEAFRMLRTNLDFVNLERSARTIMLTSAVENEGKSTTVANLAVALARADRRVVLVDLDLRRPFLYRFFDADMRPGLTDVALGHTTLEEAITPVVVGDTWERPPSADASANGGRGPEGARILEVLPAGPCPPDVGEFIGGEIFARILSELRERADVVLFDSPPFLQAGDAMALSAKVDALVVVTRADGARRAVIDELRRVLERSPAAKLGFVLTGTAELDDAYMFQTYYAAERPEPERQRVW